MNETRRPVFWSTIDLVVFDLDGTLYDQRRLRTRMMIDLLYAAVQARSSRTLRVLRTYRQCREKLAEQAARDFGERQFEETAARCGCPVADVRAAVSEWIEQRPLAYLGACRYPGVEALFNALRRAGRTIAVCSDYPAREKLKALSLEADLVVCAMDADVGMLKPDPTGLCKILKVTGAKASRALMIGDRFDRDLAAARAAGIPAIIRSRRVDPRCETFRSYHDTLFEPVFRLDAR